jgi:hypothetical protein
MAELQNLAYVVIGASDLGAWRDYATGVIGLGTVDTDAGDVGLRMDDHPWRILVETGADDDLTHAGWDLGSDADLDAYVAALRGKGADVIEEGPALAAKRHVSRLFSLADPNGFAHE